MEIYGGYSRRKRVTSSQLRKMKQGGRKADQIQQISDSHHQEVEIPQAEEFLTKSLEGVQNIPLPEKNEDITIQKQSIFTRILLWWKKVLSSIFQKPTS